MTKLPLSTLRSAFPVLKSPANNHRAVALTAEQFHYAFTNTMSEEESAAVYERYAVPGPGRVLWQGALANFNPHTPDRGGLPQRRPRAAAAHRRRGRSRRARRRRPPDGQEASKSAAVTEYKEFPERSHFTIGQDGWEEVADYALDWATEHAGDPVAA